MTCSKSSSCIFDSTHPIPGVSIKDEFPWLIRKCKNWWWNKLKTKGSKCCSTFFHPLEHDWFLCQMMERFGNSGIIFDEPPIVTDKPQEPLNIRLGCWLWPLSNLMHFGGVCCYSIGWHHMAQVGYLFRRFSLRPASWNHSNTHFRLRRCSSKFAPGTTPWSRYRRQLLHWRPRSTASISLWNVAGALHNPKGNTLNSKSPSRVQNAVFCLSSGCISTCQYPDLWDQWYKPLWTSQCILGVINPGKQVVIFPRHFIQFPVQKCTDLSFLHARTRTGRILYDVFISHLLYQLPVLVLVMLGQSYVHADVLWEHCQSRCYAVPG